MSAFIMDEQFFNQLANELAGRCYNRNGDMHWAIAKFLEDRAGDFDMIDKKALLVTDDLYQANVKAVAARYSTPLETVTLFNEAMDNRRVTGFMKWSDIQLFKYLQCLHYQMSEGDVPKTELFKRLSLVIADIGAVIIDGLPDYKSAKWSYEAPTHTVETVNA